MRVRLLLALLLATACDGLAPRATLIVAMDATAYARDSSGEALVSFAVTNPGHSAAHLVGCASPISTRIERRIGSVWGDYAERNTRCLAIIVPASLVLGPGESYRDTFRWDVPGVFRLRVLYGTRAGQLWKAEALGASFDVR